MEVQGHRGACGLTAENTLPSFEVALDVGVDSIETDVHLSKDDVPVLFHDAEISERLCPGQASGAPLVRSFTLAELRALRVGGHFFSDRSRSERTTNIAGRFASERGLDAFGIPTVAELFDFVKAYADSPDKTPAQRENASRRLVIDLELKRVPFTPETIGDGFDGWEAATLEIEVVALLRAHDLVDRSRVRSFDHRSMVAIRELEPRLTTGLLVCNTVPANIASMLDETGAKLYCPEYTFVDADIVRRVHNIGKLVIPYSVNDPRDWRRLTDMGVDGITTDYPDRLRQWLGAKRESLIR